MRRFFVASAALLVLFSCQQPLGVGDDLGPSFAISDAAHSGTVEHFYFLPPMVPDPAVDGVFDATRSPVVEICLFDVTANTCAAAQPSNYPIVFTMDSGPGSETIRLVPEDEHYIVNWHTDDFGLDPESTYRIFVKEPGPIGFADVDVVGNGGELKNVNTQEFIPLVNGRTLPIKFRIEEGLAFAVDGNGGEITAAGGQVTLDVPAGAVTTEPGEDPVPVTVDPVPTNDPSLPQGAGGLEGSIYDMGPDGLQFEEPVELTFAYDPAALTVAHPNVREEDLALFVLENGVWVPLDGVSVDTGTKKVSGFTTHFSTFGILALTRACPGGAPVSFETVQEAYDATMPGGAVELCDGTHNPVEGVVLDAPVTIRAELLATPVLPTSVELASFWVDGYATGTVVIDGLTFDFQTPDGPDIDNRSYAIKAQGTYDQLVVRNSTFDIGPAARGGMFVRLSSVGGAATSVENATFNGGQFGVSVQDTHADVLNSSFNVTNRATIHFGTTNPSSGRIENSSFAVCGTLRCIDILHGASVDVLSNTFAAPVLTGNSVPDQNQIVMYNLSATGLVQDNVFDGCAFFSCVTIRNGSVVTISNNEFSHVAGQSALEWDFVSTLEIHFGGNATLEGNTLHSCGVICYKILDGGIATIRNEMVTTPAGHGTTDIVLAAEDDPVSGPNTIVFEDNVVTGSGGEKAMGLFTETGATMDRNTFSGLANGFELHDNSTLTGQDNVFALSGTAVAIYSGTADFRFNDLIGQASDISHYGQGGSDLTCNYWGTPGGPQNVVGGIPATVYTPSAMSAIAGTGATDCNGSAIRVATVDDGSGLPFVATVAEAVSLVPGNGQILVSDGTHAVEGVTLDRPMTIAAEGDAAVIQTITELASFWVDGYATGTVVIDGLTFDFQTPDGPDIDNRSYAIKAQGTYDQLIVRNSSFDIDAGSRGSVFSRPSTVAGAATMVENVTIVGGAYGVSAQSTHVDVLGSDFDGLALNATIHFGLASPASGRVEGSTFGQCGTGRCIYVISGASVDVVSNTFAAPVLTGDGGPDQNQIIFFGGAASGLIDQNVFAGCGYWTCVDITSGATVTVTANEFNHVPGQSALEWDYASIFDLRFGADVTLDGNTLNSCGVICYKILDGATATIRNEVVNTPVDHGTLDIVIAAEDDPASGPNTIVFEDNTVTGSGGQKAIGLFTETGATANRNTFAGLLNGFELHAGSTLTGQDNVFGLSDTAVRVFDGSATFRFNDFTGQATDIGGGGEGASSDLTCNYWGNAAGPQNVIGGVPDTVYTPWAVAAVAGTGAGGCSGS